MEPETVYQQFMNFCREIEKDEINSGVYLETHHIVPKHRGGGNEPTNLIRLSRKNHILAHMYLWISYDSKKDKIAYLFMCGDPTGEAKKESGRLAQKTWTPEKRSIASKKAYQTMLSRNSGITNRSSNWRKNVSKAAKKNIAANRKSRMSQKTLDLMEKTFIFRYRDRVLTIDQSNFSDFSSTSKHLCAEFNIVVKESEHKKFIRLVFGERKIFHGITLDKVISSQDALGTKHKVQRLEAESRPDSNASTSALQPIG